MIAIPAFVSGLSVTSPYLLKTLTTINFIEIQEICSTRDLPLHSPGGVVVRAAVGPCDNPMLAESASEGNVVLKDHDKLVKTDDGIKVRTDHGEEITADVVLFATGRAPNTKRLNLKSVGVELDSKTGAVKVDDYSRTNVPSIWAVGDITDRMNLTPVALMEGTCFAVCDILEEKPLVSRSVGGEGEPWVVASWLRDHLLSPKERKYPLLWRKFTSKSYKKGNIDEVRAEWASCVAPYLLE